MLRWHGGRQAETDGVPLPSPACSPPQAVRSRHCSGLVRVLPSPFGALVATSLSGLSGAKSWKGCMLLRCPSCTPSQEQAVQGGSPPCACAGAWQYLLLGHPWGPPVCPAQAPHGHPVLLLQQRQGRRGEFWVARPCASCTCQRPRSEGNLVLRGLTCQGSRRRAVHACPGGSKSSTALLSPSWSVPAKVS